MAYQRTTNKERKMIERMKERLWIVPRAVKSYGKTMPELLAPGRKSRKWAKQRMNP